MKKTSEFSYTGAALLLIPLLLGGCETDPLVPSAPTSRSEGAVSIDALAGLQPIDLGHLGGGWSLAMDVNERGQVVGGSRTASGRIRPFLWEEGSMREIPISTGESWAIRIDDAAQVLILGRRNGRSGVWKDGRATLLPDPEGAVLFPRSMNAKGEVVGTIHSSDDGPHAFVWSAGVLTDLHSTVGGAQSRAAGIARDDRITVSGFHSEFPRARSLLLSEDDTVRVGGTDVSVSASDMADNGTVVGWWRAASGAPQRAMMWKDGALTDLGTYGHDRAIGWFVNRRGDVLGVASSATPPLTRPFLRSPSVDGLLPIPAGSRVFPSGLARDGTAVGYAWIEGKLHGVAWVDRRLVRLRAGEALEARPTAVNSNGLAVGWLHDSEDRSLTGPRRAALWVLDASANEDAGG